MKPSLHELISKAIREYPIKDDWGVGYLDETVCDELAERIIKIVRDYHLVEDK